MSANSRENTRTVQTKFDHRKRVRREKSFWSAESSLHRQLEAVDSSQLVLYVRLCTFKLFIANI